jgi:hypothetical protein
MVEAISGEIVPSSYIYQAAEYPITEIIFKRLSVL